MVRIIMRKVQLKIKKSMPVFLSLIFFMGFFTNCNETITREMEVTATAYNTLPEQTHRDHANVGAWGDTLKPGMKAIAVSRDLIEQGLSHNQLVEIEELSGKYRVLDKMHSRWEQKIDIYMGTSKERAREWGTKKVTIKWEVAKQE